MIAGPPDSIAKLMSSRDAPGSRSSTAAPLAHVPAIDGLRGIAVLLVVLFHARVPGFAGGFAGVDIFFVLSGFLITRILARELVETGTIDVWGFYARRVRRLIPALAAVLIALLVAVSPLLARLSDRQSLSAAVFATALFGTNVLLIIRGQNYFGDFHGPDFLGHTWSLSVEEQFYVVWPAIMIAGYTVLRWRRARVPLAVLAVAAAVVSFLLADGFDPGHVHRYYSPLSRAWELLLGAGVAWAAERKVPVAAGGAVGLIALVGVAASGWMSAPDTGRLASRILLPTVCSAALLLSLVQTPRSIAARVLSNRVLSGLGLVSYGWYLWHYPAMSFAREVARSSKAALAAAG
ncbi:MAG TPA: acyltransferase, partial [Gemmatimonadaceae bacterium]